MLPLLYMNGSYRLLFVCVLGLWICSELFGPVRWGWSKKGRTQDRGSLPLNVATGMSGLILSFLFPLLFPAATIVWPEAFFAGLTLVVLGACWRWYAILTLGRFFTGVVSIHEQHVLVQHGPYTLIRHPSYTGVLLIILGIGLMIGNWGSLLLLTVGLCVGLFYRMSIEEQALLQELGEPYRQYMNRTKRLIPFIF